MTKVNGRGSGFSVFVLALIAGITGFFWGDDSKGIKKLESELSQLRTDLAKSQQLYENELKKRTSSHQASTDFPLPTTAEAPSAEQLFDQRLEAQRRNHSNLVARVQAETDGEYNLIFSRLGASPELTEHFKSNFVVIHRKAIAAGEPIVELMAARHAIQKELRAALGEENYRAFKSYEESKPAIREFEQLTKFAEFEKGMTLLNPR